MSVALVTAALLLLPERAAYVIVWHRPEEFRRWASRPPLSWLGGPVDGLAFLFVLFKLLQAAVFLGWHLHMNHGDLRPYSLTAAGVGAGLALVAAGQALNVCVFRRLGMAGVFYGCRFGVDIPWCRHFPFTWFAHPQYVGTVMTIWGVFVLLRFPAPDWAVIPALETAYYVAGARLERDRRPHPAERGAMP